MATVKLIKQIWNMYSHYHGIIFHVCLNFNWEQILAEHVLTLTEIHLVKTCGMKDICTRNQRLKAWITRNKNRTFDLVSSKSGVIRHLLVCGYCTNVHVLTCVSSYLTSRRGWRCMSLIFWTVLMSFYSKCTEAMLRCSTFTSIFFITFQLSQSFEWFICSCKF